MKLSLKELPARSYSTPYAIVNSDGDQIAECHDYETAALFVSAVLACESIVFIGGNLPDERLTDKTGPNDAAHRGVMYVEARRLARTAIEPKPTPT